MRQIFTSPRLENVEGVAQLLTEAGIEIKVTQGRGYKQVSRREFSYVDKSGGGNQPAIWVIKAEDYKRARELLHGMGLADGAPASSYLPENLQFAEQPVANPRRRLMRIKMALLLVLGVVATAMMLRMLLLP